MKHFETTLPDGYRQVYYLNAKETKTGLIFNGVALLVMLVVLGITIPFVDFGALKINSIENAVRHLVSLSVFLVSMVAYIVLHELVHGAAYRLLTHRKLTFGLSWSCAFCGVPDIYVYRSTALIALLAPFVTFTLILVPLTVALAYFDGLAFLLSALLLGLHLGGCSGDLWLSILLFFRFRDGRLLVRDTGPEQFLYLPQAEEAAPAESSTPAESISPTENDAPSSDKQTE